MTFEPISDRGQTIAPPAGKVIGFLDDKAEYEAFAKDVRATGYSASKITSLYGEEGIGRPCKSRRWPNFMVDTVSVTSERGSANS